MAWFSTAGRAEGLVSSSPSEPSVSPLGLVSSCAVAMATTGSSAAVSVCGCSSAPPSSPSFSVQGVFLANHLEKKPAEGGAARASDEVAPSSLSSALVSSAVGSMVSCCRVSGVGVSSTTACGCLRLLNRFTPLWKIPLTPLSIDFLGMTSPPSSPLPSSSTGPFSTAHISVPITSTAGLCSSCCATAAGCPFKTSPSRLTAPASSLLLDGRVYLPRMAPSDHREVAGRVTVSSGRGGGVGGGGGLSASEMRMEVRRAVWVSCRAVSSSCGRCSFFCTNSCLARFLSATATLP
mmetsp:Transcript_5551/g.15497  ORF Transcript_5551/g.15497 Transcript_5551/m.15497 type:complete len:293 (+) Transcript_5551:295-1173(+)